MLIILFVLLIIQTIGSQCYHVEILRFKNPDCNYLFESSCKTLINLSKQTIQREYKNQCCKYFKGNSLFYIFQLITSAYPIFCWNIAYICNATCLLKRFLHSAVIKLRCGHAFVKALFCFQSYIVYNFRFFYFNWNIICVSVTVYDNTIIFYGPSNSLL